MKDIFIEIQPQIAPSEYGPEPCLRDIIFEYYAGHFDQAKAWELTDLYIEQWSEVQKGKS